MMRNPSLPILGAIAGDVIGSVYERHNVKTIYFPLFTPQSRFTDDTVLTMAVTDALVNKKDFGKTIWQYGRKYTNRGYGRRFREWLQTEDLKPYYSFGNGSAMRVSAVGVAYDTLPEVLQVAKQSAEVTHNHPEGIKGAQATAAAIYLARTGATKQEIRDYITTQFDYNLNFTIDGIRPHYSFDVSCQGSVPQAIVAFLDSTDFENAIRLAISIGGDSDTVACIAGGIAAAYYRHMPAEIVSSVGARLPDEFRELLQRFDQLVIAEHQANSV